MYTTEHIYFCLGINGLSHNTHKTVHGKKSTAIKN